MKCRLLSESFKNLSEYFKYSRTSEDDPGLCASNPEARSKYLKYPSCSAVSELRNSVKVQLAENKRDTEEAMTRTLNRCNEALRILGYRSSSSGDTGVSDPPGAPTQT